MRRTTWRCLPHSQAQTIYPNHTPELKEAGISCITISVRVRGIDYPKSFHYCPFDPLQGQFWIGLSLGPGRNQSVQQQASLEGAECVSW